MQPLSVSARAVREGGVSEAERETPAAPDTDDVPFAVRLDFAALLTETERTALPRPDSHFGRLPELPAMLYAAWRIRIDLNQAFDLRTVDGYAGLWLWAIRDGRREIDALKAPLAAAKSALADPVSPTNSGKLPVSLPWIAVLLWCSRPDLQQSYAMTDPQSRAGYLGWFLRHGVFELRCGDLLPDDHVALLAGPGDGSAKPPMTRYLEFTHAARPDIQSAFDIGTFDGRRSFIKWFFEHGVAEFPAHPSILSNQTRIVFEWGETLNRNAADVSPGITEQDPPGQTSADPTASA